jgi:hypothetical protein
MRLLLMVLAGCGGTLSTPVFRVEVAIDRDAAQLLGDLGEGVEVITYYEGTAHVFPRMFSAHHVGRLGPQGGTVEVPAIDLSGEANAGERLTRVTVNVVSGRRRHPDNLLACDAAVRTDALDGKTVQVRCTRLSADPPVLTPGNSGS